MSCFRLALFATLAILGFCIDSGTQQRLREYEDQGDDADEWDDDDADDTEELDDFGGAEDADQDDDEEDDDEEDDAEDDTDADQDQDDEELQYAEDDTEELDDDADDDTEELDDFEGADDADQDQDNDEEDDAEELDGRLQNGIYQITGTGSHGGRGKILQLQGHGGGSLKIADNPFGRGASRKKPMLESGIGAWRVQEIKKGTGKYLIEATGTHTGAKGKVIRQIYGTQLRVQTNMFKRGGRLDTGPMLHSGIGVWKIKEIKDGTGKYLIEPTGTHSCRKGDIIRKLGNTVKCARNMFKRGGRLDTGPMLQSGIGAFEFKRLN